ncbi:cutinase family protein [Corynebacterium aurimucosum]|uniref:cutinase family protein n=1 Tax=Corynebacterium aurimucosum TaxID=169292 RepID=UPI0039909600
MKSLSFRVSCVAAALGAAASLLSAPVASASGGGTCPDTVVLVARGSDQNEEQGEYIGPQRYSAKAPESTGFEGRNFAALFHQVEQRHPGAMDGVYVLALDSEAYPAAMNLPPLAQEGEDLSPLQLVQRALGILQQHSLGEMAYSVTLGAIDSLRTGARNAPRVVDNYEATTGCHPRWIAAGYSQGALVATSVEGHLAETGRLHGMLTFGNPLHQVPWAKNRAGLPGNRYVDYCLDGDFVCDFSLESANRALATKAERHASYFLGEPSGQDVQVIDAVAGILTSHD